ncbi:MAG: U-box domain [Chlamydiia bacterium]|nr:U-box domain [Chlamydiia bacterium]
MSSLSKVSSASEIPDCSICHAPVTNPIKTGCGHIFDQDCLFTWINQNAAKGIQPTCPLDRQVLDKKNLSYVPELAAKINNFFKDMGFVKESNSHKYELDVSKLSDKEVHIFFPVTPIAEELAIVTSIEFLTFHHSMPDMNKLFTIQPIASTPIPLFWCHFPKEYKDSAERAAKENKMTLTHTNRKLVGKNTHGKLVIITLPKSEKLLCFTGERCNDEKEIDSRCEAIKDLSNSLAALSLD